MNRNICGNALSEYGIIGSLILIISIGGCLLVGQNLNGWVQGLKQDIRATSDASKQALALQNSMRATLPTTQVDLADTNRPATDIPRPAFPELTIGGPAETAATIQVMGANGTTEQLLRALELQIAQWVDTGELTENEASALYELANAGHDLASGEKALEDAILKNAKTLSFDGKTYRTSDFVARQGFSGAVSAKDMPKLSLNQVGDDLKPVAQAYAKVQSSSSWENPEISVKVSNIVTQIVIINDAYGFVAGTVNKGTSSVKDANQDAAIIFTRDVGIIKLNSNPIAGSEITHNKSKTICTTGSGNDTGTNCQGN